MKTMKLALYNVFRNKRRTLITMLSIVSASVAIIVFGGFITFTFDILRERTIHTQLGHFQVAVKGFFDKGAGKDAGDLMKAPGDIEEQIRKLPHVKTATQRLVGSGLVSTGEVTLTGILIGVEPEKENDFAYSEVLLQGTQLGVGKKNECLIGEGLAKGLGAKLDDTLTILSNTLEGMINATECQVTGIVQTGSKTYDDVYVKMHLGDLQTLLDTDGIEKLLVLLDETKNVSLVSPMLARLLEGTDLEMREWIDLAEFYKSAVNLYTSIFRFSSFVLAFVVLLSITNTMSMCVFERFREIGTLRAIGERRVGIMKLFLSEGFIIGVVGGLLGMVAGIIAAKIINLAGGIDIAPPPGISTGYTAFITPDFIYFVWSFAVSVLASVGASIYPAYKASRIDIVKALQHV